MTMNVMVQSVNEDQKFTSVNFSEVSFVEHSFTNCTFERCIFMHAQWNKAKFYSCTFNGCNISLVRVNGAFFQEVTFNECKLVGLEFHKCDKTFFHINVQQSLLLDCNFSDLSMPKTSFHKSKFEECRFITTQLVGADFTETDLQGSVFQHCKLDKADFRGARNYAINLQANSVKKAKFSYPEVMTLLDSFDIVIDGWK